MADSVVRRCTGGDIEQLMQLFERTYRHNPRLWEADYFDWQFKGGPFATDDSYNILLVEANSRISSFIGYVPIEYRCGPEVHRGCWPQNWACMGKDYSGLTVLSALMADYDNLFYSGLAPDTVKIFKMFNVPILMQMPRWIGILDARRTSRLFNLSDSTDQELLHRSQAELVGQHRGGAVTRCDRFEPTEEFTFDHWQDIDGYCRRTGAWLNWRYFDIPRHNYRGLKDSDGQFAVYRIESIAGREEAVVRLLEWTFCGRSVSDAMATIVQDAVEHGAILIDFSARPVKSARN